MGGTHIYEVRPTPSAPNTHLGDYELAIPNYSARYFQSMIDYARDYGMKVPMFQENLAAPYDEEGSRRTLQPIFCCASAMGGGRCNCDACTIIPAIHATSMMSRREAR